MRYYTQKHLHKPDQYPAGSCYPTVYASILELELDEVPYFNLLYFSSSVEKGNIEKYVTYQYEDDKESAEQFKDKLSFLWNDVRRFWLMAMGYEEEYIADVDKFLKENPDRPYIASGISPRNVGHVVVFKNGKMELDPHPSNSGLTKIENFTYLRKIDGDWEYDRYYIKS